MPLKEMFKRLYNLSTFKEIIVQKFYSISHKKSLKVASFWSRSLRSWELEEVEALESFIDKVVMGEGEDSIVWSVTKKPYQTCSASELLQGSGSAISWRFIWKLRIPHKIKLFLWKIHLRIIPTRSFLAVRGIIHKDLACCPFCKCEEENDNHLFFGCSRSKKFWEAIFAWWQILLLYLQRESLSCLWNTADFFPTKSVKSAWRIVISASMWTLWLARNQVIFDNLIQSIENMKYIAQGHAMEWCQASNLMHNRSIFRLRASPIGAISESEGMLFKDLFLCGSNLIGFVDGSWKLKSGSITADIGGLIFEKNGNAIFSFAAPSQAICSVDVE